MMRYIIYILSLWGIVSGQTWQAESQTYFDRSPYSFTTSEKIHIDSLVIMLKDSLVITSLSDSFDCIWIANENEESSKMNLVKNQDDLTEVNTVNFIADSGFAGNGSDSWLNTNYIVNTDAVKYKANKASFGAYLWGPNSQSTGIEMGYYDTGPLTAGYFYARHTDDKAYGIVNGTPGTPNVPSTNSIGLFSLVRLKSDSTNHYRNDTFLATSTTAARAISAVDISFAIGGRNVNGTATSLSTRRHFFNFIGGAFTGVDIRKIYNCIKWYKDNRTTTFSLPQTADNNQDIYGNYGDYGGH